MATLYQPERSDLYETSRWSTLGLPNRVKVEVRESFGGSAWQTSWAYSDGGGEVVQTKSRVAPGLAPERDGTTGELVYDGGELQWAQADPRYVGSGRVVKNRKGLVIRQYEPFFSSVFEYEPEDEVAASGVASDTTYDALGRALQVDLPDGSTRSWTYGPWVQAAYDEEDNDATGDHHDTPVVTSLDSLGRTSRVYETPDGGSSTYETRVTHDVVGHPVEVVDPRGITIQAQTFDLLGRALFTGASDEGWVSGGPDKGRTRVFFDVAGQPVRTWRSGGLTLRRTYDVLRRPVALYVDEGSGERLAELLFYGAALTDAAAFSAGRVVRVYDPAGEVRRSYDFLGRTTQETRRVCEDVTAEPDWTALSSCTSASAIDAVLGTGGSLEGELESETYAVDTAYDALGRVTSQQSPTVGTLTRHTTLPGYDEGGRLSSVQVQVHGATATDHVSSVTYNARGQREKVVYGNDTETSYTYDPERFWLTEQETVRDPGGTPVKLQDLSYTRDRVGNILQIEDDSQATLWFANTQVNPTRTFTYDDQYRLVTAQGREKQGLTQTGPVEPPMGGLPGGPGTLVLRRYTQSYTYDAAGNFVEMKHQNGDFGTVLWKRGYLTSSASNQLERSSRPGDDYSTPSSYSDVYGYSDRGAMTFLPHLKSGVSANVGRDYRDMLRQADLDSDDNQAWFTYDGGLQRVRKVVEKGAATEDRIYVGPFEVWRVRKSGSVREERLTLHVMDGQTRISRVETKTVADGSAVTPLVPRTRFQLTDHLGTATIETDSSGNTITYEEYHPYGSTAWWSEASSLEVSRKRYRYTGKEKDEATGLYYHGARYYAPWLGRWCSADPIGLGDGVNRFCYVRGNPIRERDPSGTQTSEEEADEEVTVYSDGEQTTFGPPRARVNVREIPTEEIGTFGDGLTEVFAVTRLESIIIDADLVVKGKEVRIHVNSIEVNLGTGASELVDDVFGENGEPRVGPDDIERAIEDLAGVLNQDIVDQILDERGRRKFSQIKWVEERHERVHQKDVRRGIRAGSRFLKKQRLGPAINGEPTLIAEHAFDRLREEAKDVILDVGLPRLHTPERFNAERRATRAEIPGRVRAIKKLLRVGVASGWIDRDTARQTRRGLRRHVRQTLMGSIDQAEARDLERERRH